MSRDNLESSRQRRYSKKRKMDKILNILIAIVAVLIIVTTYFILSDNKEDVVKDEESVNEQKQSNEDEKIISDDDEKNDSESETIAEKYEDINGFELEEDEDPKEVAKTNERSTKDKDKGKERDKKETKKDDSKTSTSDDNNVEEVIVSNDWEVTPTNQTGPHTSSFEEGHIDYEEKLVTIRNAVELPENDIIYWSVRNDGTGKGAVGVVSSRETGKNYRVHIKWIEDAGWMPVKVEVLKEVEKN